MPNAHTSQQVVSFFHLVNRPSKNRFRLLHVGNNRVHEMRNPAVRGQFDHFRIDHQHLDLFGAAAEQHRQNQRVQTDTLTRTGSPGDQQVRHLAHVDDERLTADVFAEENGNSFAFKILATRLNKLFEADHHAHIVGNFHPDGVSPCNRSDDAD